MREDLLYATQCLGYVVLLFGGVCVIIIMLLLFGKLVQAILHGFDDEHVSRETYKEGRLLIIVDESDIPFGGVELIIRKPPIRLPDHLEG